MVWEAPSLLGKPAKEKMGPSQKRSQPLVKEAPPCQAKPLLLQELPSLPGRPMLDWALLPQERLSPFQSCPPSLPQPSTKEMKLVSLEEVFLEEEQLTRRSLLD